MRSRGFVRATILLSAGAACGGGAATPTETPTLPAGAVAACAGYAFSATTVADVAAAQGISPRDAVGRLASEARLARAAERQGLRETAAFRVAERAVLARALLSAVKAEASATDPTPAELAKVRAEHWADLDRPELVRTIHAIAVAAPNTPKRDRAREIAQLMLESTRGATSDQDFTDRAKSVPHEGIDVRVESLEAVGPDGRAPSGATFDPDFTAAAHRLTAVHEQTGPVGSQYGFHVIHLLERIPARRVTDDELRTSARAEIASLRAYEATRKIIDDRRATSPPVVERSIEDAMRALDPARP